MTASFRTLVATLLLAAAIFAGGLGFAGTVNDIEMILLRLERGSGSDHPSTGV